MRGQRQAVARAVLPLLPLLLPQRVPLGQHPPLRLQVPQNDQSQPHVARIDVQPSPSSLLSLRTLFAEIREVIRQSSRDVPVEVRAASASLARRLRRDAPAPEEVARRRGEEGAASLAAIAPQLLGHLRVRVKMMAAAMGAVGVAAVEARVARLAADRRDDGTHLPQGEEGGRFWPAAQPPRLRSPRNVAPAPPPRRPSLPPRSRSPSPFAASRAVRPVATVNVRREGGSSPTANLEGATGARKLEATTMSSPSPAPSSSAFLLALPSLRRSEPPPRPPALLPSGLLFPESPRVPSLPAFAFAASASSFAFVPLLPRFRSTAAFVDDDGGTGPGGRPGGRRRRRRIGPRIGRLRGGASSASAMASSNFVMGL